MKQLFFLIVSMILALGVVSAATGDVVISPTLPDDDDDLVASVSGYGSTTFDFYWMKDGAVYKESSGSKSTLDSSYTTPGDEWTVSAWVPASSWYDSYEVGSDTVTIQGVAPDYSSGLAVIDPFDPCGDDTLTGYVQGYEDVVFDFYWMKDGITYEKDSGTFATLSASKTKVGDEWTLSVWVPASSWYDSFELDSTSVTIDDCEATVDTNHAPRATDIHFTVTEGDLIDVDMQQVNSLFMYQMYETQTTITQSETLYAYDADGDTLKVSYDSLLNPFGRWQTADGDAGTYTVLATVTDGDTSTEATITITVVAAEEENYAPRATDIHFTVTEGDLIDVDMQQVNSLFMYQMYETQTTITQSETLYAYDADGDTLKVSYDSLLNPFGRWQTADGDAGTYTVLATVTDGTTSVQAEILITVLDDEVSGGDNNPPELDPLDDIEVDEGDTVTITAEATDSDGDVLTYIFDGLPQEATVTGNTLVWQTTCGDAGLYFVTVTVSDGEYTDTETLLVKVNDVGQDADGDGVCDGPSTSDFEGSKLYVKEVVVLNADALGSAYDVSDLDVVTSGIFVVENGYLSSTVRDDEINVYIQLQNKNSYDAEGLIVTFIFNGKRYYSTFQDLDRSEEASQVYTIQIPNDLPSGMYPLTVLVENDDIFHEEVFNLDIVSAGDAVVIPETDDTSAPEEGSWDRFVNALNRLFDFLF